MRNNKLIILIVVGILLITGVTIFTLTHNKVAATKNTCTSGHTYVTGTSYQDLGNGTHKKTCTVCGYSTTENHFDNGGNGVANSGANGICDKCGYKMSENACASGHNYITGTSYQDLGNGTHKKTCTICGYSTTEAHFDYGKDGIANSGSNGICDKCGCKMNNSDDSGDSDDKGTTTTCSHKFTKLPATGKCDNYATCGYECDHKGYENKEYCGICGLKLKATCSHKFTKLPATGKCDNYATCGYECGHKGYENKEYCGICGLKIKATCTHNDVNKIKYRAEGKTCICYCEKCQEVLDSGDHYFYTWAPTGICEACKDYECMHEGEKGETCSTCGMPLETTTSCNHKNKEYEYNDNKHWWVCEDCEKTGTKVSHTKKLGKDSVKPNCTESGWNVWECTTCDWYYDEEVEATGHKEVVDKAVAATCTTEGKTEGKHCSTCGKVLVAQKTIPVLGHKDVNDDGKCDVCGYIMREEVPHTHTPKKTYETDSIYHWKICSDKTCNQVIGAKEAHIDNNKDGKCDVCTYTMSIVDEKCTHPVTERKLCNNETEHWFECKKCGEEIEGSREKHEYVNGKCACGVECKHNNTIPKSDDTYHWDECRVCGKILNKEQHSYRDGECECGKKEDKKECAHTNKEWKSDEDNHWQVCKDCGKEIAGTRKQHTYENGKCVCGVECKHKNTTPKSDDIYHWDECNVCGEKLNKKEHSYKDGKCECGKKEEKTECTHANKEWKSDKDEHWQVCKDCGKEIEGTRGKHVNVDGKCKNCGLKDNSTAGTVLPNTGIEENMQIAIMITAAILGSALLIKLSREE